MSIVNQLSYSQRRRDKMVNNRNGFTYIANITVLVVALVCFLFISNGTLCFSILTCIVLSLGVLTTGFYICLIKENTLASKATEMEAAYRKENNNGPKALPGGVKIEKAKGKQWKDWLKSGQFYIFGATYMFARIALNVNATMLPFYLQVVTGFGDPEDTSKIPPQLALVPLCQYTFSAIWSVYFQAKVT
jgi:Na+/melibiose symporter-like transporter